MNKNPNQTKKTPKHLIGGLESTIKFKKIEYDLHTHKCPVCGVKIKCRGDCDPQLEDMDGLPMTYTTCNRCIEELSFQRNDDPIPVSNLLLYT